MNSTSCFSLPQSWKMSVAHIALLSSASVDASTISRMHLSVGSGAIPVLAASEHLKAKLKSSSGSAEIS